ncbi:MAG: polysaccharide pyruvyl transferase family protein [Clostridiales bacterium]|nr:polysaccharide pyruvyl transferase family protein [Clostridiales bacterium]
MIQYAIAWQPHSDNLGDDLRTYAAMQLLPRIDRVLDADNLDAPLTGLADGDRVIALLSGNVVRENTHWLPERHIAPVCVGVHFSQEDVWGIPFALTEGAGKDYLAACAPIGCRDERTVKLMERTGVPYQLTGCLTLTLKRPQLRTQSYVCCVDAPREVVQTLRTYAAGAEVQELSHQLIDPSADFNTRMDNVKQMLRIYAGARFVITRRLHCAMACLAMGTPVLLLYNSDYEDVSRFAPMDQMVRTMPVESFLQQLRASGMPETWTNPMGLESWQEKLTSAVAQGLKAAETIPLPLIPDAAAQQWRLQQLRQLAVISAGKIRRLEQQQLTALHEKFSFILREDSAKSIITSMLNEPEIRLALQKAARRKLLRSYPLRQRLSAWLQLKQGKLIPEDWYAQVMEQLQLLGWPESNE